MVEKKTNGQKIHDYVYNVKPILNKGGLFADGSKYYVSPQEPDVDQDVNVRFRTTADNVDEVFLIYNEEKIQMTKESSNRIFDFYTATIPGGLPFIRYHFEIHSGRVTCFYDKLGPTKQNDREYDFEICPGFKVPEWAKGAVFYQIFVDRFCNGDTSNDVLDNDPVLYPNIFLKSSTHDSCDLLFHICQKAILLSDSSKPSRASELIHLVQDYIQQHYMDEELSVKQISENVVLDASYIRKIFNKYMKCTITDYILSVRMEHASRLLEQGNTSITEVSSLVGYKDSGYFSKVFKKYYGISPKLCR